MTEAQMLKCRERLERFLVDLMEPVGRSERRHWGSVYVRGLLLDGERKSIEPLASRLPEGNVQAMQQFIGQSPWAWQPIWQGLGKRMTSELEAEPAWVIDDTGFPKQGEHSPGVARQYSGTLGKTANCQIAVSLHHVGENGSTALNWRLYLPKEWAEDSDRREQSGIPESVVFRNKWELALEMIDEVREWGLPDRVVLGDAAYGEPTAFRRGLEERQLRYALGIQSSVGVWTSPPKQIRKKAAHTGRPRTAWDYGDQRPVSAKEAALKAKGWKTIRWREGSKGWLESRFWATRVQPSHGYNQGQPPDPEVWLLVEWPASEPEPIKYFLCNMPEATTLRRLVRITKCRWKIEQDYQQLKEELGLDHYEGRSWQGWHHHVTLVMIAHAFLTLETMRRKKNFWVDPAEDAS
jgi:SRSO17 transposase